MEAGKLRRRITLQKLTVTKDSEAIAVEAWTTVSGASSVPASLEPLSGKEYFQAAAMMTENTIPVTIRYRSEVSSKLRVLYGSRILVIKNVIDLEERHIKLILMCEEVVGGN